MPLLNKIATAAMILVASFRTAIADNEPNMLRGTLKGVDPVDEVPLQVEPDVPRRLTTLFSMAYTANHMECNCGIWDCEVICVWADVTIGATGDCVACDVCRSCADYPNNDLSHGTPSWIPVPNGKWCVQNYGGSFIGADEFGGDLAGDRDPAPFDDGDTAKIVKTGSWSISGCAGRTDIGNGNCVYQFDASPYDSAGRKRPEVYKLFKCC